MRIALYQPDIAGNVGTILRLAACLGLGVDLIEPMGFAWGDRALKRAGMDYADQVAVTRHVDWAAFVAAAGGRIVLLTTTGAAPLPAARFRPDDLLLFGSEGAGVPADVHARADLRVRVPMRAGFRSLNVAMAVAIVTGEALRQTGGLAGLNRVWPGGAGLVRCGMALTPVPADHLAAIVTTLEMRERPRPRPLPAAPLRLVAWPAPDLGKYRTLFRRVGERWLWFSRLTLADADLDRIVRDPAVEVYAAVDRAGIEVGMLELDFRVASACEIGYFALVPELAGRGLGRWLMAQALARAWRPGIKRVWLHTCTLDHPSALNFYRAQGFVATRRTVETFADPRASGLLPEDAAPHVPYLASRR